MTWAVCAVIAIISLYQTIKCTREGEGRSSRTGMQTVTNERERTEPHTWSTKYKKLTASIHCSLLPEEAQVTSETLL